MTSLLGLVIVTAQTSIASDYKTNHYLVGIDFFGYGNLEDNLEQVQSEQSNEVLLLGGEPQKKREVSGGIGFRVGYMRSLSANTRVGVSVGYIPSLKSELTINDPVFPPGSLTTEIDTSYVRALMELGQYFHLSDKFALKLGGGIGVAKAKTDQTYSGSGFYESDSATYSATNTGLAWEISPALVLAIGATELELGVRYTGLPTIKETDEVYEVGYSGFGAFAAIVF